MNASQSGLNSSPRAEPQPLPENIRGAARRRSLLPTRTRLGTMAAVVAHAFPASLCKKDGRTAAGRVPRAPHEIIDPRDLKYCRNVCGCSWAAGDDPFRWRSSIPLAVGAAELLLMGGPALILTVLAALLPGAWRCLALPPMVVLALIVYFFRNPPRRVPQGSGFWVSPADGTIAEIVKLGHDEFVGGPAVRIGIFLSIFNVHLNRSPVAARVIALRYSPGEFLNALRPERLAERKHVDWVGGGRTALPAFGLATDFRGNRPADRLRCAAW